MQEHELFANIPVFEPLPAQYWVRWCSDRWVGCEDVQPVSFKHLVLPERQAGVRAAALELCTVA